MGNEVVPHLRTDLHREMKTERALSELRDMCCSQNKIKQKQCVHPFKLSISVLPEEQVAYASEPRVLLLSEHLELSVFKID